MSVADQKTIDGVTYVPSESKGKRLTQVASMLEELREAKGDPLPFEELCERVGVKYPQDVQSAMLALELTTNVDAYSYVETGSTRGKVAYAWTGGGVPDPQ
jgi:hypothetical protein